MQKRRYIRRTHIAIVTLVFTCINCSVPKSTHIGKALPKYIGQISHLFPENRLKNLTTYLKNTSETTGMVVLYDGKIIYQYGDVTNVSYNASVRKSILSLLFGKYVTNGSMNLNTSLKEMNINDVQPLLPIEKEATIHHIISARSGIFHEPVNGGYDKENTLKRGSVKPGDYFLYNNWDFNVAGHILERYAGQSVYKELEQQLALPLGFQDWDIRNQKKTFDDEKSYYPAYHMYLSTRDMAKIGLLMLNKGKWNGKQIISEDWIEKSLTPITPKDTVNKRYGLSASSNVQSSYGYMWWLFEHFKHNQDFEGAYTARGWGGQYITVIPKRKLVISHMTDVSLFVKIGWLKGGVSEPEYWKILDKLMTGRIFIEELSQHLKPSEMIQMIRENKSNPQYDFTEEAINSYGYQLLNDGDIEDAVNLFKLNTELYPNQYNTYDSYGESLVIAGRLTEGISALKKSLELNPKNKNAQRILTSLNINHTGNR